MRDDFSQRTKELLAKRVGFRCSNPNCRQPTSGPQEDPKKAVNIGVAAHITAASSDGPRYDSSLTPDQRKSAENGIWLCQKCAKLIDNDPLRYTVQKLVEWKKIAEEKAIHEIEGTPHTQNVASQDQIFIYRKIEKLMPELIAEMKDDLIKKENVFIREFFIVSRRWLLNIIDPCFIYYFEDHENLQGKIHILENHGFVIDVTPGNAKKYRMTEEFVELIVSS